MKKILAIAIAGVLVVGGIFTSGNALIQGNKASSDKEIEYRLEEGEFVGYIDGKPIEEDDFIVKGSESENKEQLLDENVSIRLAGLEDPEEYIVSVDGIQFEYQDGSFNALLPPGTNLNNVSIVGKDQALSEQDRVTIEEIQQKKEEAKKEVEEKKETENKPELSIQVIEENVLPGQNVVAVKIEGVDNPENYELYFEGSEFRYREGEFIYVVPEGTKPENIDVVKK